MSSALHDELLIHPSSIEACGTSGSKRMVCSETWNPSGVAQDWDYFGEGIVSKRLTIQLASSGTGDRKSSSLDWPGNDSCRVRRASQSNEKG